jgi:hypothetical protein
MLYQSKIARPDGLKRPKAFDDVTLRDKLRIVPRFEDTIGLVDFYCRILLDPALELPFDKL